MWHLVAWAVARKQHAQTWAAAHIPVALWWAICRIRGDVDPARKREPVFQSTPERLEAAMDAWQPGFAVVADPAARWYDAFGA